MLVLVHDRKNNHFFTKISHFIHHLHSQSCWQLLAKRNRRNERDIMIVWWFSIYLPTFIIKPNSWKFDRTAFLRISCNCYYVHLMLFVKTDWKLHVKLMKRHSCLQMFQCRGVLDWKFQCCVLALNILCY